MLFERSLQPSPALYGDVGIHSVTNEERLVTLCFLQPEVLLKNVRLVERDVETASESSNSPSSAKQGERFGAPKSKFGWLTEWRVRTALTSATKYQVHAAVFLSRMRPLQAEGFKHSKWQQNP